MHLLDSLLMWVVSPLIGTIGGVLVGFFQGKKKGKNQLLKEQAEASQAHNVELDSANNTFNALNKSLKEQIAGLLQKQTEEREQYKKEITDLLDAHNKEREEYKAQIETLNKKIDSLEKEVKSLKAEKKEKTKAAKELSYYKKLLEDNKIPYN